MAENFSWRIDHLIDIPATIQTLLYCGKRLVGRWLFKPNTSLEKIKPFMNEKIKELDNGGRSNSRDKSQSNRIR